MIAHLRAARAEHGIAHGPQALGAQLQPDQEQEHGNAELGGVAQLGRVAQHTSQPRRADRDASQQIAENGADMTAAAERRSDRRGGKKHQKLQQGAVHGCSAKISIARRGEMR